MLNSQKNDPTFRLVIIFPYKFNLITTYDLRWYKCGKILLLLYWQNYSSNLMMHHVFFSRRKKLARLLTSRRVTVSTLALKRSPFMTWFALHRHMIREVRGGLQHSDWLFVDSQPSALPELTEKRKIISTRCILRRSRSSPASHSD